MNYKTILAASGIAVIFSFSQPFSNQLANANGSGAFTLPIAKLDICDGGKNECRYVFTAKDGSNKQITMARISEDGIWYYYDMPIFTKTGVQAGYYYDTNNTNNNLVLMVVYSADQEGKSGATVSRVSYDYGENWTASLNITNNQHKFGLAVAPDSRYVAILNNGKIKMKKYENDGTWEQVGPQVHANQTINSNGLAVIRESGPGEYVSVSYVNGNTIYIKNYNLDHEIWDPIEIYDKFTNDTAWLKDRSSPNYYLAAKNKGGGDKKLGVIVTTDLVNPAKYLPFKEWVQKGNYPISGLWQADDEIIYILSTVNQEIRATDSNGNIHTEYESNQNSSMRRRVSMFFVPATN